MDLKAFEHPSFISVSLIIIIPVLSFYIKRAINDLYNKILNSCSENKMQEYVDKKVKEEVALLHAEIKVIATQMESIAQILSIKFDTISDKLNYMINEKKN